MRLRQALSRTFGWLGTTRLPSALLEFWLDLAVEPVAGLPPQRTFAELVVWREGPMNVWDFTPPAMPASSPDDKGMVVLRV
jgi:hypothetical protein